MRTAESELLRKENNTRQIHTERFKDYWKLKFLAQGRYDVNDKAGEIK